jgi:hypothetical protein
MKTKQSKLSSLIHYAQSTSASEEESFESDVRAALSEYKEFLKGNHKLKTEEEFWQEFYKTP